MNNPISRAESKEEEKGKMENVKTKNKPNDTGLAGKL